MFAKLLTSCQPGPEGGVLQVISDVLWIWPTSVNSQFGEPINHLIS